MGFSAGDTYRAIDSSVPMSASSAGTGVNLSVYEYAFFAVHWSGADHTDATITLQLSDTGDSGTWEDYPNSTYTMGAASGHHYWDVWLRAGAYYRLNYTNGTNTTGTFSTAIRNEVPV